MPRAAAPTSAPARARSPPSGAATAGSSPPSMSRAASASADPGPDAGQRRRPVGRAHLVRRRARSRPRRASAWCRARTSWCRSCSITTAATSSRTPTGGSCSRFPYEQDFTLIGTTDQDYQGELGDIRISAEEIAYLCSVANGYFARQITPKDVVWTYSGVRPLYDDGASAAQAATRDYVLAVDARERPAGAAVGVRRQDHDLPQAGGARAGEAVPFSRRATRRTTRGGPGASRCRAANSRSTASRPRSTSSCNRYGFLARPHAARLVRMYGTRAKDVLGAAQSAADLGRDFGATLTRPRSTI